MLLLSLRFDQFEMVGFDILVAEAFHHFLLFLADLFDLRVFEDVSCQIEAFPKLMAGLHHFPDLMLYPLYHACFVLALAASLELLLGPNNLSFFPSHQLTLPLPQSLVQDL